MRTFVNKANKVYLAPAVHKQRYTHDSNTITGSTYLRGSQGFGRTKLSTEQAKPDESVGSLKNSWAELVRRMDGERGGRDDRTTGKTW